MSRSRRLGELEAIERLKRLLSQPSKDIELGIGDDAAVLRFGKTRLCWTIDASIEGVHFDRRWLSLREVGLRAFEAAVSDLAAMGAVPVAALSELTLPRGLTEAELVELGRGQAAAARRTRCPIAGGNISAGPALELVTTVLGRARRPLTRSGAKEGDELWLVGEVGLARTGLELLREGRPARTAAERRAVRAWRRPRALLEEGLALVGLASAAMDVSDGLAGDAGNLSRASGVAVIVERGALERALPRGIALERALAGGEDYALLATGRSARRPSFARRIGRIERGAGAWLESLDARTPLGAGFDHLRR